MNVLLTHGYFLEEDEREKNIMRPHPPLGILYISAWLEQHDIEHTVFDTTFSNRMQFEQHLLHHSPDIIGIYVNLMTKLSVLGILQFIGKNLPNCKIVLGGPEVTYSAENFLRIGADYVVIGEGEETMQELIKSLFTGIEPEHVQGIAYMRNGVMHKTAERVKLKDLDQLPIPNRKKIDYQHYLNAWRARHNQSAISVSTMRGCPYTCKWCSRAVYGLSYRRRSPAKVVEELECIQKQYSPDSLWFVDDVFTISHKWMEGFCQELKKKELLIPYECITRADRLNEEIIKMLKETGCFRVWIGAESGSQKVIDLMDRRVEVTQVRDMIKLTKKHGIEAGTFIMLGYPGETEDDIEETIDHLKESNPDHFTITIAYPIRGTDFYEEIKTHQIASLNWQTTTDRQIEFKRTYPRKYYDYAVRRVVNELRYFKSDGLTSPFQLTIFKIKSLVAKTGMFWHRLT